MSQKLSKQLVMLARQGGGSFKTIADRSRIASHFSDRLAMLNIQIRDISHIKTKHIESYIRSRQGEHISSRTLQNEMAAIRAVLLQGGKTKLANPAHEKLSNQALNIAGASREGTKAAIDDQRLQEIIIAVSEKDRGIAIGIQLARYIGLRAEETVQSAKSLQTWRQHLLSGETSVKVIFGSKGGRPRDATIFQREKVLTLLNEAIAYCASNNGRLVDKPGLHQALNRFHNVLRACGMTGIHAPHSLRYAYSRDVVNHHLKNGMSLKEAEALVSMDLGHGDGRGAYVARVYNRDN